MDLALASTPLLGDGVDAAYPRALVVATLRARVTTARPAKRQFGD
jgi:hypothetical protein